MFAYIGWSLVAIVSSIGLLGIILAVRKGMEKQYDWKADALFGVFIAVICLSLPLVFYGMNYQNVEELNARHRETLDAIERIEGLTEENIDIIKDNHILSREALRELKVETEMKVKMAELIKDLRDIKTRKYEIKISPFYLYKGVESL